MILLFIIKLIDQNQLMITSNNIFHHICLSYLRQNEILNSIKKKKMTVHLWMSFFATITKPLQQQTLFLL